MIHAAETRAQLIETVRRFVDERLRPIEAQVAEEDEGQMIESGRAPLSSLGMMRGEIKILGDWKEMDREVEETFEESIRKPLVG